MVTGGAGGIGAAVARLFVGRGLRVAVLDVASAAGGALVAELNTGTGADGPPRAAFFRCDVSSEADVAAAFAGAAALWGARVDVLVSMAAVFEYDTVEKATAAQWDRVCAINIKGTALVCRAAMPAMRAARRGSIVLTSSITGELAFPSFVPYSASKAALRQMTRDIALDSGVFGVRVNCVAPGPILTDGGTVAHAAREGRSLQSVCDELAADVNLRRMGTVDEVARAVAFLASDEASYITGAVLNVDGGFARIRAAAST